MNQVHKVVDVTCDNCNQPAVVAIGSVYLCAKHAMMMIKNVINIILPRLPRKI